MTTSRSPWWVRARYLTHEEKLEIAENLSESFRQFWKHLGEEEAQKVRENLLTITIRERSQQTQKGDRNDDTQVSL